MTNWISVKERLPEINIPVLVYCVPYSKKVLSAVRSLHQGDWISLAFWSQNHVIYSYPLSQDDITHWMPLPQPPEEEEED